MAEDTPPTSEEETPPYVYTTNAVSAALGETLARIESGYKDGKSIPYFEQFTPEQDYNNHFAGADRAKNITEVLLAHPTIKADSIEKIAKLANKRTYVPSKQQLTDAISLNSWPQKGRTTNALSQLIELNQQMDISEGHEEASDTTQKVTRIVEMWRNSPDRPSMEDIDKRYSSGTEATEEMAAMKAAMDNYTRMLPAKLGKLGYELTAITDSSFDASTPPYSKRSVARFTVSKDGTMLTEDALTSLAARLELLNRNKLGEKVSENTLFHNVPKYDNNLTPAHLRMDLWDMYMIEKHTGMNVLGTNFKELPELPKIIRAEPIPEADLESETKEQEAPMPKAEPKPEAKPVVTETELPFLETPEIKEDHSTGKMLGAAVMALLAVFGLSGAGIGIAGAAIAGVAAAAGGWFLGDIAQKEFFSAPAPKGKMHSLETNTHKNEVSIEYIFNDKTYTLSGTKEKETYQFTTLTDEAGNAARVKINTDSISPSTTDKEKNSQYVEFQHTLERTIEAGRKTSNVETQQPLLVNARPHTTSPAKDPASLERALQNGARKESYAILPSETLIPNLPAHMKKSGQDHGTNV